MFHLHFSLKTIFSEISSSAFKEVLFFLCQRWFANAGFHLSQLFLEITNLCTLLLVHDIALFQAGKNGQEWQKKCCDNPTGNPIIRPPENTPPKLLNQVTEIIHPKILTNTPDFQVFGMTFVTNWSVAHQVEGHLEKLKN